VTSVGEKLRKKGLGLKRRKSYEKRVETSIGEKAKKKRVVDLKWAKSREERKGWPS
jgi:hypothetical protein